ncbi:MAG: alpha-2-macroglobulin family protein [Pontiellaceae bacterium]|nr:alpha-2-macroglobulin family protein [Pontiellaceae bacterium]
MKTGGNGGREGHETRMNRWFVLALAFLILNAAAVIYWLSDKEDPHVHAALIMPDNGRVEAGSRDELRWRFTASMATANPIGQWTDSGPVRFLPEIDGEYCWVAADELAFRPRSEWPQCSVFSAIMSNDLRGLDGRPCSGESVATFETTPLALVDVRQSSLPTAGQLQLDLEFNAPINSGDFYNFLKLATPDGKALSISGFALQSKNVVRLSMKPPASDDLELTVKKDLPSSAGPLGLQKDEVRQVKISRELAVLRVVAQSRQFAMGQLEVMLNGPVDLETAKGFIRIEPGMDFAVEPYSSWDERQHFRILGEFEAGHNYSVTFLQGFGDGQVKLAKDDRRTVYFPPEQPSIEFVAKGTYLSTQGNLSIPIKAVNTGKCTVTVRQVYANNLVQLAARESGYAGYYSSNVYRGLDRLVGTFDLPIDAEVNEVVERSLQLRPWLEGRTGVFHIEVSGSKGGQAEHDIVVSDLGISLRQSDRDMLVWINSIRSLDAVEGATVEVYSLENQLLLRGETDGDGLVRFDPEKPLAEGTPFMVVVKNGDDLTYLRLGNSGVEPGGAIGARNYLSSGYEAFVFTDRGIYRPGETVHFEAVVRGADVVCPESFPVQAELIRPDGKLDQKLNGMLGERGTVEFEIALAEYVATGRYVLKVRIPGDAGEVLGETAISVEEFVPPQIRTRLDIPEGRVAAGEPFGFSVEGRHLFGRAAEGLETQAQVDFSPLGFAPAQWSGYVFGDARRTFNTLSRPLGRKNLDADGKVEFSAETSTQWRPSAAIRAIISGTVQDIGGRTVTAYGSRVVDVYPHYIGIKRPDGSLETGATHSFDLVLVSPDAALLPDTGTLETRIEKLSWVSVLRQEGDHYVYRSEQKAIEIESNAVAFSEGRASVAFEPNHAGHYRLVVENAENGTASSMEFSVILPGQHWDDRSMMAPDRVAMELDYASYQVGDTALLTIRSPFVGKALLTVESDEILWSRVMTLSNNTAVVELAVEASYRPNVYCSVSVVRPALPEELWGQHRAAGRIPLLVDQPERKLDVALELPEEIRPGTRLEIPVQVLDADGKGCPSEVVLAAVDEGICMLTGFTTPDPYDYFFGPRRPGVELHDLYARLIPETIDLVGGSPSTPGGGMLAAIGKRLNPIKARRFKPVALWSSAIETDTNGMAQVVFDVPEFTGELRIMAVAVDPLRFGSAEQSLLVKRPLVVQSSLPRFLAPDDLFTVPVHIYNESEHDGEVRVQVDCNGPLVCDGSEQMVWVAAGSDTNLLFQLKADAAPGKAVCRLVAEMGGERYEEPIEIAVRPAVPLVVKTGNERIEAGGGESLLELPSSWLDGTGETSLWLSSMPSVTLGGSLDYLLNYPYGCLEQTTSKSFPLLYLSGLAEQMRPGWLGRNGTAEFVNAGIYRILSMQKGNGGFSLWPNGGVYEWGSIYAVHFLVEADKAGYEVPADRLSEALNHVEEMVRDVPIDQKNHHYDASYACFVLALAGRPQHGVVDRLREQWDVLEYDTRINVIAALLSAGQRRLAVEMLDRISGYPATPELFETNGSLRSETRGNAFLLSVLLDVDPENKEIPALVRRLEAAQSNGRWLNTQDNAMAIMAMGKYTERFAEKQKPIAGRVEWNGRAKTVEFANRDELRVPLEAFDGQPVRIENQSEGELFLHWKSEGIPASGEIEERDRGIRVRRELLDREGHPVDTDQLRQGDLYIVKLSLWSDTYLDNVVVEDLLPAGLEVENSVLNTSQRMGWVKGLQTLSMQHLDIRDDRVIAFPQGFGSTTRNYCYAVRAVTVGEFVWPAVSASSMYDPSIESIHGKSRVHVVDGM